MHRDVDLVIKNEKHMDILLKFLIYTLRTLEGSKNTADALLNSMQEASKREFKQTKQRDTISKMREYQFMQMNEMKVFKKVFLKYKIMIVRSKISFSAFASGKTINELFHG